MADDTGSLVEYYQRHHFNPVLIRVEEEAVWASHFEKRRNLYERHLGLPLPFLNGASVLEFGANSGENALVPALFGARLTLVEPNPQVLPRLRDLFARFDADGQIDALACEGVGEYRSDRLFDLVVAEGFLYTLPDREPLLRKIAGHVAPGRFGVLSFNDRYGSLLEYLRRAILFRACNLTGVTDPQSAGCLALARELYADDFARLNSSRTFEAWWRDTLINPFCRTAHLWSVPEVLRILTEEGCEFHSSSPVWNTSGHYDWYKNLRSPDARREQVLRNWRSNLSYFLTGLRPTGGDGAEVGDDVLAAAAGLIGKLCDTELTPTGTPAGWVYPTALDRFLSDNPHPGVRAVNAEWRGLFAALGADRAADLLAAYSRSELTRTLWGTAYSYVCFQRTPGVTVRRAA